jgi:hypothetical protein
MTETDKPPDSGTPPTQGDDQSTPLPNDLAQSDPGILVDVVKRNDPSRYEQR